MNLRGRLPICIIAGLMFTASMAYSQSRRGNVMITIMNEKLLGIPASGSRIEEGLGAMKLLRTQRHADKPALPSPQPDS